MLVRVVLGGVGFFGPGTEAGAIVIRHDVPVSTYQALDGLPETQSIVRMRLDFGEDPLTGTTFTGSGVHIGGGYILTAAHLIHGNGGFLRNVSVRTREDKIFYASATDGVRVHPGFNPLDYSATKGFDIALMRLGNWEDLFFDGRTNPFEAATVWVGDAITGGELLVGGFGRRGTGLEPGVSGSGVYLSAKNVLDGGSSDGRLGYFDFDSPTSPIDNLGSSTPLDLEGMIAQGDSGGGWFSLHDGQLVLSHTTSGIWANLDGSANGGYGDIAMGVNLGKHWDWISASARELDAFYSPTTTPVYTTFNTLGGEPSQVSGLFGQALSDTAVRLTWQPAPRAVSYNIYRGGMLVATTLGTTWDDSGLLEETSYSYEVGAVNTIGSGPRSVPLAVNTMAFVDANPLALEVRSPSATLPHEGSSFLFTGRAGGGLTGQIRWSNSLSGESAFFPHARDWFVSIPLAVGTNRVVFNSSYVVAATNAASDSAGDGVYSGGWTNGSSGGSGFTPWVFGSSGVAEISRRLVSPSPGLPEQPAFGVWSARTGTANARRDLAAPLSSPGSRFGCTFKNRYIRTGGQVGFELTDSAGQPLFAFYRVGGEARYRITDAVVARDSGISQSRDEFPVEFVMTSSNAYSFKVGTNEVTGVLAAGGNIAGFNAFSRGANPSRSDVFVETFDYPVGSSLAAQSGGTGFSGGWDGGDSTILSGSGAQPKWLRVGASNSTRVLPSALTTGTNPLYFSFVFRSSNYSSGTFSGFSLRSTNAAEAMFFGVPSMSGALGFDARGGGGAADIVVANTNLVPGQPYLVTYGLLPGTTAGKVDVKMWMTTNTAIDSFALVRSQPVASLVGSRTNFTFDRVAIGGDFAGTLEIASARCWNNLETSDYELFVNNLFAESVSELTNTVSVTAPDVIVGGDSDGDGLPDWWEQAHFGHPTAAAPGVDDDRDGFSNLWEFRLGTLPVDAASRFGVVGMESTTNAMTVQWQSSPGKTYRLMASAGLANPGWVQVGEPITATAETTSQVHVLPVGTKQFFYRVEFVEETAPMGEARSTAMMPTGAVETGSYSDARTFAPLEGDLAVDPRPMVPAVVAGAIDEAVMPMPGADRQMSDQVDAIRWADGSSVAEPAMSATQKILPAERARKSAPAIQPEDALRSDRPVSDVVPTTPAPVMTATAAHAVSVAPSSVLKTQASVASELSAAIPSARTFSFPTTPQTRLGDAPDAEESVSAWINLRQWLGLLVTWLKGFFVAAVPVAE